MLDYQPIGGRRNPKRWKPYVLVAVVLILGTALLIVLGIAYSFSRMASSSKEVVGVDVEVEFDEVARELDLPRTLGVQGISGYRVGYQDTYEAWIEVQASAEAYEHIVLSLRQLPTGGARHWQVQSDLGAAAFDLLGVRGPQWWILNQSHVLRGIKAKMFLGNPSGQRGEYWLIFDSNSGTLFVRRLAL